MDRTAPALGLASSVAKLATRLWLGSAAAEVVGNAGDILAHAYGTFGDEVSISELERLRFEQFINRCTEIVTSKLLNGLDLEYRAIDDGERAAAFYAVRDTFERGGLTASTVVQADVSLVALRSSLEAARRHVLQTALLSQGAEELYDLALDESCAYLIEMVATLPQFTPLALTDLLRRSTVIADALERLLVSQTPRRHESDFAADYHNLIARELDRMELIGVTLKEEALRTYPLTVSYVHLALANREDQGQERGAQRVEDALAGQNRVLVVGEAGSGKTTLIRWLAVSAARGGLPAPLADWNECTPFFLPLRAFAQSGLPQPQEFLKGIAGLIANDMPPGWVHEKLRNGRALVLIDGLDELAAGRVRQGARDWLAQLISTFPRARYVVTSRPAAVLPSWPGQLGLVTMNVQPLGPGDVRTLIRRWHSAVRAREQDPREQLRVEGDERSLLAAVDEDRHLRALTETPLLCALLCALNRDRFRQLPRQRTMVYRAALDMLLERRDVERQVDARLELSAEQTTILLQELAFWLLENGWADVPVERAQEQIGRSLRSLSPLSVDAATVMQLLLERTGLLRSPVEGRIDFVHRTFQEYLAGKAAVDNDNVGELVRRVTDDDQWRDVFVMAVGHARPSQAAELLRGILGKADEGPAAERLRTIAVACLQTVVRLAEDVREELYRAALLLIPPSTREAAEALAYAGPDVLAALADKEPASHHEAAGYIRTAALIGGPDALKIIAAIAPRFDAIEDELMRAWAYFDPSVFAQEVLTGARLDQGITVADERLLPSLRGISSLRHLELVDLELQNLVRLGGGPPSVMSLRINRCPLQSVRGIEDWEALRRLDLVMPGRLPDLSALEKLSRLESLHISFRVGRLLRLRDLMLAPGLQEIYVRDVTGLILNLEGIPPVMQPLAIFVPDDAEILADVEVPDRLRIVPTTAETA